MTESVVVALITGGLSLLGVLISSKTQARKTEESIQTSMAVTDTKLDELTREVREHNHFAQRMPVVEEQIKAIDHQIGIYRAFASPDN